jgi:acetyl-CoA acetyltransferase
MREAVIVSSVRTAVGKAGRGTLRATRPDDLAATAIKEAISRAKGLEPAEIEDVIIGCATPEAEQGMNVSVPPACKPSRSPPNGSSLAAQKSLSLAAPNPCP